MKLKNTWAALCVALALLGGVVGPVSAAARPEDEWMDAAEVREFTSTEIEALLREYQTPGAALAVVRDGQALYSAGFGLADLEANTPVDAARTRFHIGSLTKLFTWTAVMQLVEQGRVNLDADVNQYLPADLQLPAAFEQPVTLRHLMTHTPGFEDKLSNLFSTDPAAMIPLKDYLKRHQPRRVYAPGETIAYSNWGAGLAGLIVEQVTGEPYAQYVQRHIFEPSGMSRSTFALSGQEIALGYAATLAGEPLAVQEYLPNVPAGGASATADDMARFMLAHLDGQPLLRPETEAEMRRQQFTEDARMPGLAGGFMELRRNGQRILWHSGGTAVFYSMMVLIPEQRLGFFVSFNGLGGARARLDFREAFLNHYFPVETTTPTPMPGAAERLNRYTGLYREARFAYSTVDKLISSLTWVARASANPDGSLHYRDADWVEVEPGVFKQLGGQGTLIFKRDGRGRFIAVQDIDPHEMQIRMDAWENPTDILYAGGGLLLALLSALVVVPAARRRGALAGKRSLPAAVWLCFAAALLLLGFLVWAAGAAGAIAARNPVAILGSLGAILRAPLVLLFLSALLMPLAVLVTLNAWRDAPTSRKLLVYCSVWSAAAVGWLLWLTYWNLLGWRL